MAGKFFLLLFIAGVLSSYFAPCCAGAKYEVLSLHFPDEPGLGVLQLEGGKNVVKDSLGTLGSGTVNLAPARGKVVLKVPWGRQYCALCRTASGRKSRTVSWYRPN